ncbi:MAG: hypothetical protein LBM98_07055 [Oscillospiraceae bacterium]|nr:hypothetical protein [Oscillospiraceae bacterium]
MRRLCEAPVSLRYAERYRCEAIQCREDNLRTTYRRILRQPGLGFALPRAGAISPRTARGGRV